jgi:hypothetical protein
VAVTETPLTLRILPDTLAICRMAAGGASAACPDWLDWRDPLLAVVRRGPELSIVCRVERLPDPVPPGLTVETGWRALQVQGPLDFALVGILADLSGRLAQAGVSLFALSTFETDLVLVRAPDLPQAVAALSPPHVVTSSAGA